MKRVIKIVKWIFPTEGWCKLNTNGASKGNPGQAGCGDLIRDASGAWIAGFAMNIVIYTAFVAELWGVLKDMEVAWNIGIRKIIIESDSTSVINFLRQGKVTTSSNKFFKRIFYWQKKEWEVTYSHVLREGNACTD